MNENKNWIYYEPKFEYEKILNDLNMPWAGHKYFAYDFIRNVKPKVIVELGTYRGTSFFSFCQAAKDGKIDCEINAVDTWEGDEQSGFYSNEVFEEVKNIRNEYYSEIKTKLFRKKFDEALSEFKDNSIDVLHIDGLHTHEAVKHDFEAWLPKLKDSGIVLFHDIVVTRDDFGVFNFWKKLKREYETMEFCYSYGLGILFKKANNPIFNLKEEIELHYSYLVEDIKNEKIGILMQDLNKEKEVVRDLRLSQGDEEKKQNSLEQNIRQREEEILFMKDSKFWKLRNFYIAAKAFVLNTFFLKKSNSLISVIIPVYDRTWELKEAIESILNQTYEKFEIILVTDGSPKETMEVIESYKSNSKVKIFYYRDNSGNAVRGRNRGIKESKGEFIAFQDSDDIAEPSRLKKSLEFIEKYNADIVYGGWRAKLDGTRTDTDLSDGQEIISPECNLEMLKNSCVPCQSTVMVRKSALLDVGGLKTKMKYREDHELWLRLAHFGYKFKAIPEILTSLRLHKGNNELNFKDNDNHWYEMMIEEYKKKANDYEL